MMVKTFSFSKIDQYLRCPLAYKMINIDNMPYANNYSMLSGTIAHRFMELSWKKDRDEVLSTLYKEYKDYTGINEIIAELEKYIPEAYKYIIEAELPISFELGPYNMRGVIDRLDKMENKYRIVDYKYGYYEYNQHDLDNSIQLSLYAYHIMDIYKVDSCDIAYHNLKQNSFIEKTVSKSDMDIKKILLFINMISSSELLDDFPARVSANCMNCAVRLSCNPFKEWLSTMLPQVPDPDVELNDLMDYYYDIQEKEKAYRYQKKALQTMLEEVYKSNINMDKYDIDVTRYGNLELKKSK